MFKPMTPSTGGKEKTEAQAEAQSFRGSKAGY
jgi:hypothetical protein